MRSFSPSANQRSTDPVADCGLRRVDRVRVVVGGGRPVAQVVGVAHRYPRTFRVSLESAARLAEAGYPVDIEQADGEAGVAR
jgi:hypothetical protein